MQLKLTHPSPYVIFDLQWPWNF